MATGQSLAFRSVRDLAILAVLWSTGMRRSEVAHIETTHLDLVAQIEHIPRTKSGRPRTVGLSDEAVRYLRRYLKRRVVHSIGARRTCGCRRGRALVRRAASDDPRPCHRGPR